MFKAHIKQRLDFHPAAKTREIRDAIDSGLRYHHKHHLPRHFERSAPNRYSPHYDGKKKHAPKESLRAILKRMTPTQYRRWQQMAGTAQKGRYAIADAILHNEANLHKIVASTKKQRNARAKLPLVFTGHLRDKVLHGIGRISGPVKNRKITFSVPYYMNFRPNNTMDKRAALTAVRDDEADAIADVIDATLSRALGQRARAPRGFGVPAA